MKFEARVPGKLMLAGEWAVLEVGVPCIVMAIDKYVTVELQAADTITIDAPDLKLPRKEAHFDGGISWNPALNPQEQEKLLIAQHAMETTLQYLKAAKKPVGFFAIKTNSEDCVVQLTDGSTKKIGFGSSAAACVGIVKTILQLHEINVQSPNGLETVFKLSCMAHFNAQGKVGSSFDVAASTYGGVLVYKRFDPAWLQEQVTSGKTVAQIVDMDWPALQLKPIQLPAGFQLLIGYTGPDSSTKEMIQKIQACKTEKKEEYNQVIAQIRQCVQELILAIQRNDPDKIIEELQRNRNALIGLSEISGVELETEKLAELANICEDVGCAGKFSGSGGGGLGIGVCFEEKTAEQIRQNWKKAGIEPVQANIASATHQP